MNYIDIRDEILNVLDMKQVLEYYGIKTKKDFFCCPFHNDKNPSAKIYKKSYCCFGCGNADTFIGFVMKYFNLNFQEALEKINYDFGLGLRTRNRITKKELEKIKEKCELERKQKEQAKIVFNQKMIKACNRYRTYDKIRNKLVNEVNYRNCDDYTRAIIFLEEKIDLIEQYMEDLYNKREF